MKEPQKATEGPPEALAACTGMSTPGSTALTATEASRLAEILDAPPVPSPAIVELMRKERDRTECWREPDTL